MRTVFENAQFYAESKSHQDMRAALHVCSPDFELDAPPFGRALKGTRDCLEGMARFFALFPDYRVEANETLCSPSRVLMVGHVFLTPQLGLLGLPETGRTAKLAFSAAFETRGAILTRETFLIDLIDLCMQTGLPISLAIKLFDRARSSNLAHGQATDPARTRRDVSATPEP